MTGPAASLRAERPPTGTWVSPESGGWRRQAAMPEWVRRALNPDPDRAARGRAEAARVRDAELAAGRPWPPPTEHTYGLPQTVPRPLLVRGGLAALDGCVCGTGVPHVVAPAGGWRCPRCASVTLVCEPVSGPRLPTCECLGDGVVCVHVPVARGRR